MLYEYRRTDVDNDLYNDSNSDEYYSYDLQQTAESTSASSIPTIPSSTDSEDSRNNEPRVNKTLVVGESKTTRLKDLGLNDQRVIVKTSFTWEIENWAALVANRDGFAQSPRVRIEGYSWRIILYPGGNQSEIGNSTTSPFVSLYIRARPLAKVEFPSTAEFTLEMSNPDAAAADVAPEAETRQNLNINSSPKTNDQQHQVSRKKKAEQVVSQDMQNQVLSYTPVVKGFDTFIPLQGLADQGVMTADGRVNITAKLRLLMRK